MFPTKKKRISSLKVNIQNGKNIIPSLIFFFRVINHIKSTILYILKVRDYFKIDFDKLNKREKK